MRALTRTEIGKLTSVRSSGILLGCTAALAGLSVTGAIAGGDSVGVDIATEKGRHTILHGAGTAAVFALVLGVLITAGEFRHGTITDTYLTTPRRGRVVAAKLAAGLLAGVVLGMAAVLTTVAIAMPWLAAESHALAMDRGYVWLTLLGAVLWCAGYAAIGVAVGAFVRNPVLAIVGSLAWLLIVEQIIVGMATAIGRWLPAGVAAAAGRAPEDRLLPQWGGVLMLTVYAAVVVAAATLTTIRSDVT